MRQLTLALSLPIIAGLAGLASAAEFAEQPTGPAPAPLSAVHVAPAAPAIQPAMHTVNAPATIVPAGGPHPDAERGDFVGGFGFFFIKPHFDNNPAFTTTFSTTNGALTSSTIRQTEFNFEYDFAPRVWFGYVCNSGLGIRARYWHFDEGANESITNTDAPGGSDNLDINTASINGFDLNANGPGESLAITSDFELDVWDLEATQEMNFDHYSLLASGGLRYAHLRQTYDALQTDNTGTISPPPLSNLPLGTEGTLSARHWFKGFGPTLAVEARKPLIGRFTLFGSTRGAILFGDGKHTLSGAESTGPRDPDRGSIREDARNRDDVLPVGELEVGAEWWCDINHCRFWLQTALNGQIWDGAGNASSEDANLGFVGLSFMAGLQF